MVSILSVWTFLIPRISNLLLHHDRNGRTRQIKFHLVWAVLMNLVIGKLNRIPGILKCVVQ
jgi:hypothetical protein